MNEKYKITSPIITPENYPVAYKTSEERINVLIVYYDSDSAPTIIFDEVDSIIEETFIHGSHAPIILPNGIVMIVDPLVQWKTENVNHVATTYVRNTVTTFEGDIFKDSVFGDVLFFSNYDLKNHVLSNSMSYSVPYETVQELLTIYVKQKNKIQFKNK